MHDRKAAIDNLLSVGIASVLARATTASGLRDFGAGVHLTAVAVGATRALPRLLAIARQRRLPNGPEFQQQRDRSSLCCTRQSSIDSSVPGEHLRELQRNVDGHAACGRRLGDPEAGGAGRHRATVLAALAVDRHDHHRAAHRRRVPHPLINVNAARLALLGLGGRGLLVGSRGADRLHRQRQRQLRCT